MPADARAPGTAHRCSAVRHGSRRRAARIRAPRAPGTIPATAAHSSPACDRGSVHRWTRRCPCAWDSASPSVSQERRSRNVVADYKCATERTTSCVRWFWSASCRRRTARRWRAAWRIRSRARISPRLPTTRRSARCWRRASSSSPSSTTAGDARHLRGGNPAEVVANGVRVVKMDPVATLLAMGFGTRRLGIGATASTTYYEPFDVARRFQTVDHMLGGRAAWNVVTSVNDGEAQNMGREVHLAHDLRYDRADEFMEIVLGCWDGWEDDALVVDKESGLFADPDKVHRLEYRGQIPDLARHLHRAALAAGPSGDHPGRRVRSRQGVLGALGGDGVRRLSGLRGRQAAVRRLQAGRGAARTRSGPGDRQYDCLSGRRRDEGRGRGQDGGDRSAVSRGRWLVAAVRGAELRLRDEGHGRGVHRRGAGGHVGHAGDARPRDARDRPQSDGARLPRT